MEKTIFCCAAKCENEKLRNKASKDEKIHYTRFQKELRGVLPNQNTKAMQELNAQISSRLNFNYLEKTLADDSFGDGFHLPKSVSALADMYKYETESIASSATSKRRIDLLFGETRSVSSEYQINHKYDYPNRKVKSLIEGAAIDEDEDDNTYYRERQQQTPNEVQVRIEKIFSEISSSDQEMEPSSSNTDRFAIQHLGSIPVQNKIHSVNGLQEPLKKLFFKYQSQQKKNATGLIRIGDKGLQIEYNGNYGGKIEKLYPFSNIAIWASLKFVHRINGDRQHEYAFVPVVANANKTSLFDILDEDLADKFVDTNNVPIFTVVMREPDTLIKQLVCHGFVCESSEDAVIIAATLYRVLMNKLGKNRKNRAHKRHSNKQAPNRLCSIGETSSNEIADPQDDNYARVDKSTAAEFVSAPPPPPTRPPRKAKQPTIPRKPEESVRPTGDGRDILTKIAIPRSGSFLNTNRLGSRYADSKPATSEPVTQKTAASPLGFVEMFNELQSQEGLKTIDEILRVIIKSEGMSYNELKPIYKEFLLKLALVLSKDELYHRSKAIMKSQQSKRKLPSCRLKKVITTKSGLKNILHKPFIKLKTRRSRDATAGTYMPNKKSRNKLVVEGDGTSTDSFMLSPEPKLPDPTSRLSSAKNAAHPASIRQKAPRFRSHGITSTSEDSDYPNANRRKFKNKLREDAIRPSSSGYFSFSECSYDTESCTCVSADKCYCSLSKSKPPRSKPKTNYSVCSCDTMKCRKRNKCYCAKPQQKVPAHGKPSLVEQLKQKGFAISESSLSPDDTKKATIKDRNHTKLSKSLEYLEGGSPNRTNRMQFYDTAYKAFPCRHSYKYSPSHSSDSSKASHKRSVSSDNLAVDYSMFAKSDARGGRENTSCAFGYRNSKRLAAQKQNIVYAELARPHASTCLADNYSMSPRLMPSVPLETPSMLAVYPHTAVRPCSCACSCQMFAGEPLPTYKKVYGSTPFHGMNMENVFGYFP